MIKEIPIVRFPMAQVEKINKELKASREYDAKHCKGFSKQFKKFYKRSENDNKN